MHRKSAVAHCLPFVWVQNIAANNKSRMSDDTTEWQLIKSVFEGISTVWGPFKVDTCMFASGLHAQVNSYVSYQTDPFSKNIDAFIMPLTNNYFYAFPPLSCINRCLTKLLEDVTECVMIIAVWPTR